jgi:hypothetical protein
MSAAKRLAALDQMPADRLCHKTAATLEALCRAMNEETTLLRAGRYKETAPHTAEKTRLAQEYVGYVRAVQRQSQRLLKEAPEAVQMLRAGHEQLVTQMAENLRVIATAKTVTEDLITDVAATVGQQQKTSTYGASGQMQTGTAPVARGLAINRAL